MLGKDEVISLADKFTKKGYLCSEAVLLALSRFLNIRSDIIPKIATGFGAGFGQHGEVCGALSGAVMGLGLRFGRTDVSETAPGTSPYQFSSDMVKLFVVQFGHIRCRDLLGLDLQREEDRMTYKDQQLWEMRCREIVRITTGLVYDLFETKGTDSKS